jgi:EAL domain-containing protein (putative c-di-GMP-specific phosphodiesterase class I)
MLAVMHATITLVENLGMTSVAEGVELPAQAAILQSMGCRYAQGYLFSRAVPPEHLLEVGHRLVGLAASPAGCVEA